MVGSDEYFVADDLAGIWANKNQRRPGALRAICDAGCAVLIEIRTLFPKRSRAWIWIRGKNQEMRSRDVAVDSVVP